mgnify:CR=1 FL=1
MDVVFEIYEGENTIINSITFMQVSKAQENEAFKSAGKWLVGLKVLNLDPDVDSVTSIGGEAKWMMKLLHHLA